MHIHTDNKGALSGLYLFRSSCTYVHLPIIIKGKETTNLRLEGDMKGFAEGQVGGAVGKKGRGESSMILFQLNYIHKAGKSHMYHKISTAR